MAFLGRLARSILNINTIWGLMIVVACIACAWQHYTPTTTAIPTAQLHEGDNRITLRIINSKNEAQDFDFTLAMHAGQATIDPNDGRPGGGKPWLISAGTQGDRLLLTWDTTTNGSYQLAADGVVVSDKHHSRLVTLQSLTDAAFDYAQKGFEIALGLVAAMVLFLGLMKVGEDAGIVQLVARVFYPVIRFLFPDVPKDHPANGAILMNWTTTLLGLGNAATPFGLKAMQELQSLNPHKNIASNSQVMLLGYNTAGLALLPTTLLAVRKAAGCSDPFEIIGTCLLAGAVATFTAIVMVKLLGTLPFFSVQAAVAEEEKERTSAGREGA